MEDDKKFVHAVKFVQILFVKIHIYFCTNSRRWRKV